MFIGREHEMSVLEETYHQPGFHMTVIYGRRRIGKSTLITEFIKDKRASYYIAAKSSLEDNIKKWSAQFISDIVPEMEGVEFSDLEGFFKFVGNSCKDEKTVIALDEIPYIAEVDESFLSRFQGAIDSILSKKNIYLIISGSAISFMEKKILSEKSPVFGRRDSQIKLEAFNYRDSALFVPEYSPEDKAICYGITGGVAKYLDLIDSNISIYENIKKLFFSTEGYLFDETRNLLTQEFTDVTIVNNIIEQIASGENTLNTISAKVGEKETTVLYSLEKLIETGLVEKRRCITEEKNKKKVQYVLRDHMFKFWYKFIPKAVSVIEMGGGSLYFDQVVKQELHSFMGSIFEVMCRYYTLEQGILGRFDTFITAAGVWWGTEPMKDDEGKSFNQSADIDVVGISDVDKTAVVGECKFKNEKIDKGVYESLKRRSGLISGKYKVVKYLLFSLSGFTDWFDDMKSDDTLLLTIDDLYS